MASASLNAGMNNGMEPPPLLDELKTQAMHTLLGLAPGKPVNHYRLLGLSDGEINPDVIERAAERQMQYLKQQQLNSTFGRVIHILMSEVMQAQTTLLNLDEKKAYDAQLAAAKKRSLPIARSIESIRAAVATTVPTHTSLSLAPPPTKERINAPDSPSLVGVQKIIQQHVSTIAAAAAVALGAIGVTAGIFSSSSGKKEEDPVVAKAPEMPQTSPPTSPSITPPPTIPHPMNSVTDEPEEEKLVTTPSQAEEGGPVVKTDRASSNAPSTEPSPAPSLVAATSTTSVPAAPAKKTTLLPNEIEVQKIYETMMKEFDALVLKDGSPDLARTKQKLFENFELLNSNSVKDSRETQRAVMKANFSIALKSHLLPELARALAAIRTGPFVPEEVQKCIRITMDIASKNGEYKYALELLRELEKSGVAAPNEVLEKETAILLAAKRPSTYVEQINLGGKLLQHAYDVRAQNPELAKELTERANITVKNSSEIDASRTIAEYLLVNGDSSHALALFARIPDHPLQTLAFETHRILYQGRNTTAEESLRLAREWFGKATIGGPNAVAYRDVGTQLARNAISLAENQSPIDTLSLARATSLLPKPPVSVPKATPPTTPIASVPSTSPPSAPQQQTPTPAPKPTPAPVPPKNSPNRPVTFDALTIVPIIMENDVEPPRPWYVHKEAEWRYDPETKTGSWYYVLPDTATFAQLVALAREAHAIPFIPNTLKENKYAYDLVKKNKGKLTGDKNYLETWIGYVKGPDGKLYSLQGALVPPELEHWHPGEGQLPKERHVFIMNDGGTGKHADSYDKPARCVLEYVNGNPPSTKPNTKSNPRNQKTNFRSSSTRSPALERWLVENDQHVGPRPGHSIIPQDVPFNTDEIAASLRS